MTLLLSCQNISKSYATKEIFHNLSLNVFQSDRIGLIGPNGSGKSTLLKILAKEEREDSGEISLKKGVTIGYVPQVCEFEDEPVEKIFMKAIREEVLDHEKERLVQMWMSEMGFQKGISAKLLSGGWKKRLSIAKELIASPDLLLLDEPTNHLDLEGVLWLEKFLIQKSCTYLLVSHDRYFLQNMTNRVVELDFIYPDGLFSCDSNYLKFLEQKEQFLQGQLKLERSLKTKAKRETQWLKAGVKARTTKSQSRIDEAHLILQEHKSVVKRNKQKRADIAFTASERQTRKLLVAKNLAKSVQERTLFHHLDFTLSPGTRIGLMGPNGSGKTTLLKLIADELKPDCGTIKRAEDLKMVYFDQHRAKLSPKATLRQALSPNGEYVTFQGRQIHVNGWCKRFLFSPDFLDIPIEKLSGGERARILVAHLMLQDADLLLLDEPTNDLDIATLEALEESLLEFSGAVVLITHDRCMLDRVCNVVLALGSTLEPQMFADFSQWKSAQKEPEAIEKKETMQKAKAKLSYLEKKECDAIERKIEKLEAEVKELQSILESKEIAKDPAKLEEICGAIGILETQIEEAYLRWEELDNRQ